MGIAGNAEMNTLERARVARARRLARLDPFGLRYRLPEALLVRVRRLLTSIATRPTDGSDKAGFSLDDVRCVESDLDDAAHLIAVIDR